MRKINSLHIIPWLYVLATFFATTSTTSAESVIKSSWIDPARIMVIYNTVRMDSIDPAEPDTFSHDMGEWYMTRYGMPTTHLFGYNMGTKVRWNNPGAFDFLQAVANYIQLNNIQIVLLAPGTPLIVRDTNNLHNLALDSLAGHALWFANVKGESPTCTLSNSVAFNDSNLYFPYEDMGDGASPFVVRTNDATRWCPFGGNLMPGGRQWYDTLSVDLQDHPSVRPYGRIGLPYYLEAYVDADLPASPELDIPLENTQFVKDLVNGGIAARTSINAFNTQTARSLLFFGREGNTASFIDVESSVSEAMSQDAIKQGVSDSNIVRVTSSGGWNATSCLQEPVWDYTTSQFMDGLITPKINPLIFSAGGVNNTKENVKPWPSSLDVQPGLVASVSVSNGRTFAGSMLKRGATTVAVNLQHPQNSRLHAWFSVFRQLVAGTTVAEAMITSGGSERGGYVTGSIWGDPLHQPFGLNTLPFDLDEDKDGLYLIAETIFGTDPALADTDADGLTDFQEICYDMECNTYAPAPNGDDLDANNPDTEGDGIHDGWEIDNNTDPLVNDSALDPDQDGLTNLEEFNVNANPNLNDTDSDGLSDGDEVNQYESNPASNDTDSDGMQDKWEVDNGLDLLDASDALTDNDNDGLNNLTEFQLGIDPNNGDGDSDGLTDGDEVNVYLTNPLSADTDNDHLTDREELIDYDTDPLINIDTDLDAMPDDWENVFGFNANDETDGQQDADNDGAINYLEWWHTTDPQSNTSAPVFRTLYVDGTGCNAGGTLDGSSGNPFCTFNEGIDSAQGGDTVIITGGSYNIDAFSYTVVKPIKIQAVSGGRVKLNCGSTPGFGLFGLSDIAWGSVSGVDFNCDFGVSIVRSRNIIFENNNLIDFQFAPNALSITGKTTATVRNSLIKGNLTGINIGGVNTQVNLENVTVTGNNLGISLNATNVPTVLVNSSIIYGNATDLDSSVVAQSISYSLTGDPLLNGINGNITANPLFVDAANENYHLQTLSPAIDAGNPIDAFNNEPENNGGRINMGAYGNTTDAAIGNDADSDGLTDQNEQCYDGNCSDYNPYNPVTNPTGTDLDITKQDTDTDGVDDAAEIAAGTDPLDPASFPDVDSDGIPDKQDNCRLVANGPLIPDVGGNSQRDTDADGFGNICDADLDNDGLVGLSDFSLFRVVFGQAGGSSTAADNSDFDGDGLVGLSDFSLFRSMFGQAPGP